MYTDNYINLVADADATFEHLDITRSDFDVSIEGVLDSIKSFAKKAYDKVAAFFKKVYGFFRKLFTGKEEEVPEVKTVMSKIKDTANMEIKIPEFDMAFLGSASNAMGSMKTATVGWVTSAMGKISANGAANFIGGGDSSYWSGLASTISKIGFTSKITPPGKDGGKGGIMSAVRKAAVAVGVISAPKTKLQQAYANSVKVLKMAATVGKTTVDRKGYDSLVSSLKVGLEKTLIKVGLIPEPTKAQKAARAVVKGYGFLLKHVRNVAKIEFKVMKDTAKMRKEARSTTNIISRFAQGVKSAVTGKEDYSYYGGSRKELIEKEYRIHGGSASYLY